MMGNSFVLDNLQERSNSLQSILIRDQLRQGAYNFGYFKSFLEIINEYKKFRSFFKVSHVVNVSQQELLGWYIQGQMGNPQFRSFYLAIRDINNIKTRDTSNKISQEIVVEETVSDSGAIEEGDYIISPYGDGWSYKTFRDGEKIFLISGELKTLKEKVRAKRLPLE